MTQKYTNLCKQFLALPYKTRTSFVAFDFTFYIVHCGHNVSMTL